MSKVVRILEHILAVLLIMGISVFFVSRSVTEAETEPPLPTIISDQQSESETQPETQPEIQPELTVPAQPTETETEPPPQTLDHEPVVRDYLRLVAHAGGAIGGYAYSNALEALEASVAYGFTLIEIDFMPTADGEIVLTHVWQYAPNRIPGAGTHIMTHEEFMASRLFNRYTTMDLSMLITFLDQHPEVRIITDTKDGYDNYTALYAIAERYPNHRHRFIAQAYRFEHVPRIRALGFDDVIVTLYLHPPEFFDDPASIARLALEYEVYAVTIQEYGISREYAAKLFSGGTRFFAHTVNNPLRAEQLREMGFYGIYTIFLTYDAETSTLTNSRAPQAENQLTLLTENMADLSDSQRDMLRESLLYRLETPVYIRHGGPEIVSHTGTTVTYPGFLHGIASPIAHFRSGIIYLPLGNLLLDSAYTWVYTWDETLNTLTIDTHTITDGFMLYRSSIFISQSVIEDIFPYQILRAGDYVLVAADYAEWSEYALLSLGQTVFAGF